MLWGDAFGNGLGQSLAEQMRSPSAAEQRLAAMDNTVDNVMGDVLANSERFADLSADPKAIARLRAAEMARITKQIEVPQYVDADGMRIEISGVGSLDPRDHNREIIAAASSRGDDLSPTLANADRLGLANDPSLMSYGEQMRNVGRFVGDLAVGAAKGLYNLIPETAAFAYRMTGYSMAGVVSLFDTDISDQMFSQYGKITGRVHDYDNNIQAYSGMVSQIAAPLVFKGGSATGVRLYETEQSAKLKINYDYRHWLSGTQTLSTDTTFYAYKNSNYLAASYQPMQCG